VRKGMRKKKQIEIQEQLEKNVIEIQERHDKKIEEIEKELLNASNCFRLEKTSLECEVKHLKGKLEYIEKMN
jgi:hypothetical protein